ncbi:DUF3048 domain-containing protein [Alteribacillus sp. HJP-4]|uniref:DUF3048 domain-containing protein n=1 Tax=Alteribacillus sp. HJP-4 TaxID=2775394 RepID=UPI0035CCF129
MKNTLLFAGLLLLFVLAACLNNAPDEQAEEGTDVEEASEEEVNSEISEEADSKVTTPLTGVHTEKISPKRPLAAVINNHPKARPHSGLPEADVVYEVLTEGDVTRLLALYQSKEPEEIGTVRSARGYFIELADGYDAMFIAHGWSPEAERMLQSGETPFINGLHYDGTLFQRSSDRPAPHNSYISYEDALTGLAEKNYDLEKETEPLRFRTGDADSEGVWEDAENVDVQYGSTYTASYKYDESEKVYARSSDGETTVDKNTKKPVKPSNVFIVEAPHQVIDRDGRRQISLEDGGNALLLQRGKSLSVQWKNENGRILPKLEGETIPFVPGQTWIHIVPAASGLSEMVSGIKE